MLPNFLGIGTQRGATTWLFNCLKEHPEVFVPDMKELSFFDINYDKGLSYYSSFFRGTEKYKAIGEITPDYLYCKKCPRRIAEHLPGIRMIIILRNPIDRAFSAYQFFIKSKRNWTFEESLERDHNLLDKGIYFEQLERYFSYHNRDQFLILLYEDLVEDNFACIDAVNKFLSVDQSFCPSWIGKTVNTVAFPKIQDIIYKLNLEWSKELIKRTPLDSLIRKSLKRKKLKSKHGMKPSTRLRLVEYFTEPNHKLEQLLGLDLSTWTK